jgi:hypothetical protein
MKVRDSMDGLRTLIVERIRERGYEDNWLLDVYYHLIESGVPPADAICAMERFVDEAVALKKKTMELIN